MQNYRYYVRAETNPSHSWTQMESEAFWELFREYEEAGGNGYMHTEVLPAMELLAYCMNNPVAYSDPSGRSAIDAIKAGFALGNQVAVLRWSLNC